jgi:uncharacterized protein (TIGR02453 family)
MAEFEGFPEAALDFYDDLELDNSKAYWDAHKKVYVEAVQQPLKALMADLADEFGTAKIFRPNRDVRFAKDKSPYKTHQGAYVPTGPATGWYFQIAAPGAMVGAGFYEASGARLAALREAIDDKRLGARLEKVIADLEALGWVIGGETLKTAPRGYDVEHPRIALLRHKTLTITKTYGFEKIIHSPKLVDRVRSDWREARPLLDWLAAVPSEPSA